MIKVLGETGPTQQEVRISLHRVRNLIVRGQVHLRNLTKEVDDLQKSMRAIKPNLEDIDIRLTELETDLEQAVNQIGELVL